MIARFGTVALLILGFAVSGCKQQVDQTLQRVEQDVEFGACHGLLGRSPFRWESEPFKGNSAKVFTGVLIRVSRDGSLHWNGQIIDYDVLHGYARQLSQKDRRVPVLLQVEPNAGCDEARKAVRVLAEEKACDGRECLVIPADEEGPIVE